MFEKTISLSNPTSNSRVVWIEPWCEQVTLPAGATFEVVGRGAIDGDIEIDEQGDQILVFAWPTSVLRVTQDGLLVWSTEIEVPPVPPGMTLKGFVTKLFYRK